MQMANPMIKDRSWNGWENLTLMTTKILPVYGNYSTLTVLRQLISKHF